MNAAMTKQLTAEQVEWHPGVSGNSSRCLHFSNRSAISHANDTSPECVPVVGKTKSWFGCPATSSRYYIWAPRKSTRHFLQPVSAECAAFATSGWLRKQHNIYTYYIAGSTLDSLPGGDSKTCTPCTDCRHQTYRHQMLTNT
jgi:hypothetical protein